MFELHVLFLHYRLLHPANGTPYPIFGISSRGDTDETEAEFRPNLQIGRPVKTAMLTHLKSSKTNMYALTVLLRHGIFVPMAKFVVNPTKKKDGFVFSLVASNGVVIGTSQTYRSSKSAQNGIESVRFNRNARIEDQTIDGYEILTNPKYEVYKDEAGEFRFRLKAMNGDVVFSSEGYSSKSNAKNGIESIRKYAEEAKVEVLDK